MRCWGLISPKTILLLLKKFLKSAYYVVEKLSIVHLSCYGSKGYTKVLLGNSKIAFLGESGVQPFVHRAMMFWLYTTLQYWNQRLWNSLVFIISGDISSSPAVSLFFIFDCPTSRSFWVNCSFLMSSWSLIIFLLGSSVTLEDFPSRFLKCYFCKRICSSWLGTFSLALEVLFVLLTTFIFPCFRGFPSSLEFLI